MEEVEDEEVVVVVVVVAMVVMVAMAVVVPVVEVMRHDAQAIVFLILTSINLNGGWNEKSVHPRTTLM